MEHSTNYIAVPPGATIGEQLETRGMAQKEFSIRMDMSEKHISRLINGKVELTKDVALRLESVLGIPASFWNRMETQYREQLAKVKAELSFEEDMQFATDFPYAKIAALGWLDKTRNLKEKVSNLRKFFEVANLGILTDLQIPGIAFRCSSESEKNDYALAAWAQKAKIESRSQQVSEINIKKLKQSIPAIRALTVLPPASFCEQLQSMLSECGIAVVFLAHIPGSFLHGAAFQDGNRMILGLTVRGKDADRFWFSLFHEIYHIIAGHVHNLKVTTKEQEDEADLFASNTLIPVELYDTFTRAGRYSRPNILKFADEINIAPGIVVGRLQKQNLIPYEYFHDLKEQYQID